MKKLNSMEERNGVHWGNYEQLWPAESRKKVLWILKGEKGRNSQECVKTQKESRSSFKDIIML